MTPEELDEAMRSGDAEAVIALLEHATEAERRAAAPVAVEAFKRVTKHWQAAWSSRGERIEDEQLLHALHATKEVAVYGTATKAEIEKIPIPDHDQAFRVLCARRPEWLGRWAEEQLRRQRWCWPVVRRLQRAGVIDRPNCDEYTLGMLSAAQRDGAYALLEADPELLESEVWRLFEVEGDRDGSLSSEDKYYRKGPWAETFARLAAEGRLSRDRLLDASLDALQRDFEQFRAGWFSRFHESLSPTVEEREARRERYLGLLGSRIPPTASFALKALLALEKAGKLPSEDVVGSFSPLLAAREKGTVTSALKALDRAAGREPSVAQRAAETAAEALLHEASEVQEAGLALIEKHGDPAAEPLRSLLLDRVGDVAASLRGRMDKLVGGQEEPPSTPETDEAELAELTARAGRIPQRLRELAGVDAALADATAATLTAPALRLPFHDVPRLDPQEVIVPIETLDELIDSFGAVLEALGPPEEIERVVDGVSRLCDERPEDFDRRTGPLRKRATKLFRDEEWAESWNGWPVQDLSALALAWTTGKLAQMPKHKDADLTCFTGLRLYEVAKRVVGRKPRALLALPTHRGGWIDPRELVHRAADGAEPADAIQALLRLAPDHRPEALAAAGNLRGELGDAIRHALGADGVEIGSTAELWAAAARARSPLEDDPAVEARHPKLGPDCGKAVRVKFSVDHETRVYDGTTYHYYNPRLDLDPPAPKKLNPWLPTVMHYHTVEEETPGRQWSAAIWPGGRHAWFGLGVRAVGENLDWWEANWQNRVYLEALLEPDTDLGELGVLLLCMGLGAKEATESALSVDALVMAAQDGRVTGELLGEKMALLAPTGLIKSARWAKSLGVAARTSPLLREVVRTGLERMLAAAPEMRPVDAGAVFSLLQELCVESGAAVSDPAAREYLRGIKGGKSGKAAKAALDVTAGDRAIPLMAASAEALRGRVERTERWMGRSAAS